MLLLGTYSRAARLLFICDPASSRNRAAGNEYLSSDFHEQRADTPDRQKSCNHRSGGPIQTRVDAAITVVILETLALGH